MGRLAYDRLFLGEVGQLVCAPADVVAVAVAVALAGLAVEMLATAIQPAAMLSIQPDKTPPITALADYRSFDEIIGIDGLSARAAVGVLRHLGQPCTCGFNRTPAIG